MGATVAVVSGDPQHWARLNDIMVGCGLSPVCCDTLAAAKRLLGEQPFELAVCEDELPDGDFRTFIAELRQAGRWMPVVVVSRQDDWGAYLEAMVAGAFDYVAFPPYPRELERAVDAALAESRVHRLAGASAAA